MEYAKPAPKGHDGVREPSPPISLRLATIDANHLEELRRQARENWRQLQRQKAADATASTHHG